MNLPVTVIGGYLGAGKTTLINYLLRNNNNQKLAVLVNEFGDLPIDQDLILEKSERVMALTGGCVCCSFGGDLANALDELSKSNFDLDHIIIEASGVAIPNVVQGTISLLPQYQPNGTIVLAAANQVRESAGAKFIGDTILRQLEGADIVLVTKCDLVDQGEKDDIVHWCHKQSTHAQIIPIHSGKISIEVVLNPNTNDNNAATDTTIADDLFKSIVLKVEPVSNIHEFAKDLVSKNYGIIRAKGFVNEENGQQFLIQIVGKQWSVEKFSQPKPDNLVVIGLKNELAIERLQKFEQSN